MTIYHQIKVGYKKLTNLVDIIQKQMQKQNKQICINYMSLYCDLDLEIAKTIFLHNAQIHGDVSPYKVWLQKIQKIVWTNIHWTLPELVLCQTKFGYKRFKRLSGQTLIELFLNFHCDFGSHPQDTPAGTVSD